MTKDTPIRFQFVRAYGLSSTAIAWFGAGAFSHVDAVMPDGTLIGARSDWIKTPANAKGVWPDWIKPGVQRRPPEYEKWKRRMVLRLDVEAYVAKRFYELNVEQLGKKYDNSAIWGFAAGRDWRDPRRWFCSEQQTWCAEKSTALHRLCTPDNKVMPGMLAVALSAAGAYVDD